MKIMSSLKRDHHAIRACIVLVMTTLLAATAGCTQAAPPLSSYDLTIASTAGGLVTIPGEDTFTYDEGTVVNLMATPDPGYRFAGWTGDVGAIDNASAASTTIVINATKSIAASFIRQQYDLTTTSTAGGLVTIPGEDTFTYDEGTVVNLVAEAEEGHKFVNWTGDVSTMGDSSAAQTTVIVDGSYSITANFESKYTPMVAGGALHTVGLKIDGTVVATGYNEYGECVVDGWTDVIQVLAGQYHTVGLRADGSVITAGWCVSGQCNVGGWSEIIQVAGSFSHTVGLKLNGTVVAVGNNDYGQCNVGAWTDIVQVAGGGHHTVALRSDGTVIAAGDSSRGQCSVGDWSDIIQIAAGYGHTAGLRSDGTVVAVGDSSWGQCNVSGWTDVVQLAAGYGHTVGLRSDGTAIAVGPDTNGQCDVDGWTDVIQVGAGYHHTIGLRSDGTAIAVGNNGWLQCYVGDWMLT